MSTVVDLLAEGEVRDWHPAPGWDPAAAELASLDPAWTGIVRYAPESAGALAPWLVGPVAAALTTAGRPLLIWWRHAAALPVDRIFVLAETHPQLTLVVAVEDEQSPLLVACLAAATPGLRLATTGFGTPVLERVLAAAGAERLVFGGGDAADAEGLAERLRLSPAQRHRVVARTAHGLLRGLA